MEKSHPVNVVVELDSDEIEDFRQQMEMSDRIQHPNDSLVVSQWLAMNLERWTIA